MAFRSRGEQIEAGTQNPTRPNSARPDRLKPDWVGYCVDSGYSIGSVTRYKTYGPGSGFTRQTRYPIGYPVLNKKKRIIKNMKGKMKLRVTLSDSNNYVSVTDQKKKNYVSVYELRNKFKIKLGLILPEQRWSSGRA